eukprot:TRINITY_DN11229_c0_g1_i1.p1 TRINITY_DN11229_c0_g1~~TRINITY_DN11229_c0_g1_i1.p1  ORF type:complete len:613 (+),score=91.02 TRINITY_DN11229_c0_g1_i1:28-1866(+)
MMQSDILEHYKDLIKPVIKGGVLNPSVLELLEKYREQNAITPDMHQRAIKELNINELAWHSAVELGEDEESPDENYGPPKCRQVFYSSKLFAGPVYFNGLIVAPHLRQWYDLVNGKKDIFWREKGERKASWLELFFDLVFVCIVYNLGNILSNEYIPLTPFIILYTAFWRIWIGITSYSSRYEHHDWFHPVIYCATMLGLLYMNILMPDAYKTILPSSNEISDASTSAGVGFSVFFIFASLPTFTQYLFASWTEMTEAGRLMNSNRKITYHPLHCAIVMFVSFIPWITAAIWGHYDNAPFWASGLLFSEIAMFFVESHNNVTAPICVEHWGERISLFLMVHLGESMFAVATDFTTQANYWQPYLATFFGLIIPFAFRRVHFEVEGTEPKEPHALRRNRWFAQLYNSLHWLLCMSVIAYALGFKGLQKANLAYLKGYTISPKKFLKGHEMGGPESQFEEMTQPPHVNCSVYLETHGLKRADVYFENTTCNKYWLSEQYSYLFIRSQFFFCWSLALTMGIVAAIGCMSRTKKHREDEYLVPHSQIWRLATRIICVIIFILYPIISDSIDSASPLNTIVMGGVIFFFWAVLESFYVLKKKKIIRETLDEAYEMVS